MLQKLIYYNYHILCISGFKMHLKLPPTLHIRYYTIHYSKCATVSPPTDHPSRKLIAAAAYNLMTMFHHTWWTYRYVRQVHSYSGCLLSGAPRVGIDINGNLSLNGNLTCIVYHYDNVFWMILFETGFTQIISKRCFTRFLYLIRQFTCFLYSKTEAIRNKSHFKQNHIS